MAFDEQDLNEFKTEAFEILDVAEKNLFLLESGGEFRPSFDAVFRALHNLKGASGMMELLVLQAHVHELESIFMNFKEKTEIPSGHIHFFLRGIDAARSILEGQEIQFSYQVETKATQSNTEPSQASPSALDEFLSESLEIVERASKHLRSIESKNYTKEIINDLYREIHSLKGAFFLFNYNDLGSVIHNMESSLEYLRDGMHSPSAELINQFFEVMAFVENALAEIKDKGKLKENLEQITKLNRELKSASNQMNNTSEAQSMKKEVEVSPKHKEKSNTTVEATPEKESDSSASSIRVPVSLLDHLMTLVGEMVLVRNQVLQFSNDTDDLNFLNLSKRLNSVTSEIQGEMMKTRMQPIGNVLTKYHRVVRDLSQELGKNIILNLQGTETELDKSLIESIKDPLTHIVRNSCDHGIEMPELRKANGKAEQGSIQIHSFYEGGQVVVEVSDDGKGLNPETLSKKAIEKGLVTQAQVSAMSEKEILSLIFAPGFSTAATVTNISGRGVGMDVVRTNIEKMGGTVELSSKTGQGTTTRIKIPLTLAIIPALIIKNGTGTFAIPQIKLEELVRVDESSSEHKIEYLHGTPIFRLRGNILPLVDLNKVLGNTSHNLNDRNVYNIAVVKSDHLVFGLIIDEIQDTADIVVKPLNRLLKSLHVYSGATILGDGNIALILDIQGLAKVANVGHAKELNSTKNNELKNTSDFQEYLLIGLNSPSQHAIVLGYVHRLEEFKRTSIEYSGKTRVIRYGKEILQLVSVNEILGYETNVKTKDSEMIPVVVIQKAGVLYGLEVDEIIDTLSSDAVVNSDIAKQNGFFGTLNTPEGIICAIDPFEIISLTGNLPKAEEIRKKQNSKLKILLVEDTVFFRKAVTLILEKEGHEVTIALDGQEAIEILNKKSNHFDLIISDIEMPRMNGFELAAAVKSNPAFAHLPLLALSSRADKKYFDQGMKAGFNRYLEKLKPTLLIEAISDLVPEERKSA